MDSRQKMRFQNVSLSEYLGLNYIYVGNCLMYLVYLKVTVPQHPIKQYNYFKGLFDQSVNQKYNSYRFSPQNISNRKFYLYSTPLITSMMTNS